MFVLADRVSCATPARRASASRRFRSRISRPPRRRNSTPCTCRPRSSRIEADDCAASALQSCRKAIQRDFDAVVLAVPPRQVERLLGDPARYGVDESRRVRAYPIVDVHLWHDGGSIGLDFAAALESPLQWIFEKAPGYLCCSISAADEYLRLPTAGARSAGVARSASVSVRRSRMPSSTRSAVTRNPEATWLPRVGTARPRSARRTRASRSPARGPRPGWPDTMESAVRSGTAAARAATAVRERAWRGAAQSKAAWRSAAPASNARVGEPLERASGGCCRQQSTEGWWSGELETNVTMTAEHVLLFRFLGLPIDEFRAGAIAHILRKPAQRRIVGAVLRRPGRSEHDDRSLRRAQSPGRRSRSATKCAKRST